MNKNLIEIEGSRFIIDMMYARCDNMAGVDVYQQIGLGNHAYVHRDMWEKLQKLIPFLEQNYLKMKICDAYRPPIAHKKLKEIIPMPGFFIATPELSQHCHGTAIDVVLTSEEGEELPYPTLVDAYHPQYALEVQHGQTENFFKHLQKARHDYENPQMKEEIANRKFLKNLMVSGGFDSIPHEWWHYNLPNGKSDAYPMIEYDEI